MVEINQFKEAEFNRMVDLSKQASHELSDFIKRTHELENALQHIINLSRERVNSAESIYKLTGNKNYKEVKEVSEKEIKFLVKQLANLKEIFAAISDSFKIEDQIESYLSNISDSK